MSTIPFHPSSPTPRKREATQRLRIASPEKTEQVKKTSQGVMCMWHGLDFRGWRNILRHKPAFAWSHTFRWASITGLSLINSLERDIESLIYGRAVANTQIEHPPIFVLGHWRSGTTLLHNLMTLDPELTFPNLYQCLFPHHFLLTEKIVSRCTGFFVPKTRPMDNIPIGWKSSQEDEIALVLDGGISPYLMMAMPMRTDIYGRYFDPRNMTDAELGIWKGSLLRLMKKLTYLKNKSIVLKSPSHTFRIATLLEMFPNAKFVYIYRDPLAVINSTMHLRKTMYVENSLGKPNFEGNEADMLHWYETCIRTYEESKRLVPAGQLHEIRFEDLEQDPLGEVRNAYKAIGLNSWDAAEPAIQKELPKLAGYRKNSFHVDQELARRVYDRMGWVYDLYGYPSPVAEAEAPAA